MKIIGLAGSLAAGKDLVGSMLEQKYGFLHVSTSDMLRAAKKEAFGNTPEALLLRNDPFANELRAAKGPGVLATLALESYNKEESKYSRGVVISGIRSIGEAEAIHDSGGIIIFVDAEPKIRYERTIGRGRDSNEHNTTFEEFMNMEQSERPKNNDDKTIQNLNAMKQMADIQILNNGNDIEAFETQVEQILSKVLAS